MYGYVCVCIVSIQRKGRQKKFRRPMLPLRGSWFYTVTLPYSGAIFLFWRNGLRKFSIRGVLIPGFPAPGTGSILPSHKLFSLCRETVSASRTTDRWILRCFWVQVVPAPKVLSERAFPRGWLLCGEFRRAGFGRPLWERAL